MPYDLAVPPLFRSSVSEWLASSILATVQLRPGAAQRGPAQSSRVQPSPSCATTTLCPLPARASSLFHITLLPPSLSIPGRGAAPSP